MNAILIDPKTETINLIQMNNVNDLIEMRRLVDCDMIELAISFDDLHVDIFCDEEGWLRNREIYGFELDGIIIPSKALVLGYTEEGKQLELNKVKQSYMISYLTRNIIWRGELSEDQMPEPTITGFAFDKDGNLIY